MDPIVALAVLGGVVALAGVLGWVVVRSRGRLRTVAESAAEDIDWSGRIGAPDGTGAIIVLGTPYCSQCGPVARRVRDLVADRGDATRVIELDLTTDSDLARRINVLQTPTILGIDASATQIARIGGVPTRDTLVDLLDRLDPHRSPASAAPSGRTSS